MNGVNKIKDKTESKIDLNGMIEEAQTLEINDVLFREEFGHFRGKVYMAGKLFNEADRAQRGKEYSLLLEANKKFGIDKEIFSPIHAPINDKSTMPTSLDIFNGDESPLMSSEVVFADMSDFDPGVMMEMGMVIHKDISLYAYLPDIRIQTAGEYEGIYVPFGSNQFVIGGVEKYFDRVYSSFSEALKAYIEDHGKNVLN